MSNGQVEAPILELKGLKKYFPVKKGFLKRNSGDLKAVDDINLKIYEGENVGLVGESGCGKSTLGRCITRLYDITQGEILFRQENNEVVDLSIITGKEMLSLRKEIQIIFQDPYASLDPRMTVMDIIGEPLLYQKDPELKEKVKNIMDFVGLEVKHLNRYPHAFSGGQRQRIGIARALVTNPRFIVADEAVSALDVSIQAQVINLLKQLQKKLGLTLLFISHDLTVVQHICSKVAVMYVGKIVEIAETKELFSSPKHPYTEALMSSVPSLDLDKKMKRIILKGDVANPANPPSGCYFHPRCSYCLDLCREQSPGLKEISPGHSVACHRAGELGLSGVY